VKRGSCSAVKAPIYGATSRNSTARTPKIGRNTAKFDYDNRKIGRDTRKLTGTPVTLGSVALAGFALLAVLAPALAAPAFATSRRNAVLVQ
jgi:hypothetical protein